MSHEKQGMVSFMHRILQHIADEVMAPADSG
jgi:hypothetical protein